MIKDMNLEQMSALAASNFAAKELDPQKVYKAADIAGEAAATAEVALAKAHITAYHAHKAAATMAKSHGDEAGHKYHSKQARYHIARLRASSDTEDELTN